MPGAKPRVVYWLDMPRPYFIERFNALADRDNVRLEAWFSIERAPDRSWDVTSTAWRFPYRYLPRRSLCGRPLHLPVVELKATRPDLFVSEYPLAPLTMALIAARITARRVVVRALPNFDAWSQRTWWREASKHFLFRAVDGAKVPGSDGAYMAQRYGLPRTRIFRVTQAIDARHYAQAQTIAPEWRQRKRAELGLHGCVFLYVGRLWSGKGLDYLFEAYRRVQAAQPDVSLLLIGDGVEEARYRDLARDLPSTIFAGFVQARDLAAYYALADVMVFPTLGDPQGLVVEEAMAAGLPVICTEAAGDIRHRLPDGVAGYVVPAAAVAPLADRMLRLAADPAGRARFAAEAARLVGPQTPEDYARDFEALVQGVLALPPRRSACSFAARALGWGIVTLATWDDEALIPIRPGR